MKFTVRPDFVVHHVTRVETMQNGQTVMQEQSNSYWGGQTVDFDADEALQHAHKLEPADKDARKFLDSMVLANAQASASGVDAATLAAAIADALARMNTQATPPAA